MTPLSTPNAAPGFEANALTYARGVFMRDGKLPRVALIEAPYTPLLIADIPVPRVYQSIEHALILHTLRTNLATMRAVGVAMLSEAWAATATRREDLRADLSNADDRREIVVAVIEHRALDGGVPRVWEAPITRNAEGAATLGPFALLNMARAEGRMIGLLPARDGAS